MFFFIVWNYSFFMGIIFRFTVVLVLTFNARGVYDFITKVAYIPVNLVPFFNGVLFLLCLFLKSGVMKELKRIFLLKSIFIQTGQNFAVGKSLVRSACVWRIATATLFLKKIVIYELIVILIKFTLFKKMAV